MTREGVWLGDQDCPGAEDMLPMSIIAGVLIQLARLGKACRQLCHGADQ